MHGIDTIQKINKLASENSNAQRELDLADQSREGQESPLEIAIKAHAHATSSV